MFNGKGFNQYRQHLVDMANLKACANRFIRDLYITTEYFKEADEWFKKTLIKMIDRKPFYKSLFYL